VPTYVATYHSGGAICLTCYRGLRVGDDARADGILAPAHGLLQKRADKISDEELRHSFLESEGGRELLLTLGVAEGML
jgi:hypothetical protein